MKKSIETIRLAAHRAAVRAYRAWGAFILWALRPGLAPLIRELSDEQDDLKRRKIDWADVWIDDGGTLRKHKKVDPPDIV